VLLGTRTPGANLYFLGKETKLSIEEGMILSVGINSSVLISVLSTKETEQWDFILFLECVK